MGIIFALGAFVGWGVGDFLIQRCTRKAGVTFTLWFISCIGSILLLPFVLNGNMPLSALWSVPILIATATHIANGFFLFWLFKHINLSIVQPVISLELPIGVLLAAVLFQEAILPLQWQLIFFIFFGIVLLSVVAHPFAGKKMHLEKGVLLTVLAACVSASMNLATGAAVEQLDPWFVIWALSLLITIVLVPFIIQRRAEYIASIKTHPMLYVSTSLIDVGAWVSFSFGVLYLPIWLVLALSQGYILLSVILGIIFNKERLQWWQYVGLCITVMALIALASTVSN